VFLAQLFDKIDQLDRMRYVYPKEYTDNVHKRIVLKTHQMQYQMITHKRATMLRTFTYTHSRKLLPFFLCLSLPVSLFSQSRIVLKNDVYMVLNTLSASASVFVVLDNGNSNALSTSGTGGNIITKHEKNQLKWNIGTNTGTYTLPFTTATTATNASESKLSASVNITTAGVGNGNIKFSSYTDNDAANNYKVSDYKPSDVAHVDDATGSDNSANVVNRWWIIDANGYTDKPDVTLSFTYDDDEVNATGNTLNEADIFPQRWNSTDSVWDDVTLSGTLNMTNNTLSGISVSKENFFRSWALVSSVFPLPVGLSSFEAKCDDHQTVLAWSTVTEFNNSHFEIQHTTDLQTWTNIDRVDGAGNSMSVIDYEYRVKNNDPFQGLDYYRLKQVDYDGIYSYSNVESTHCGTDVHLDIIRIYPNPSTGEVNVLIHSTEAGKLRLKVHDVLGRLILDDVIFIQQGSNVLQHTIQAAAGKYVLTATLNEGNYYDYGTVTIR